MANIITDIRLSGITYQIQGEVTVDPTLDSGSTNPVANSAITTALDDKVNVADNNASAYTFEDKIGDAQHEYSEHFAGPFYIKYIGSSSSSGYYYAGTMTYYISESSQMPIDLYFNLSNSQITATTTSSAYFDIEIENGEAAITFKDGYYLREYYSQNGFVALAKTTYESGQSADVIEDTVYDVFDKLNDKIDKTSDNAITGGSIYFSDGYLDLNLYNKNRNTDSSIKIDSSTIKSSNNGLSVQFETSEVGDKILNVGSGSYGTLFSTGSYNTSFNEFTITFNPNYTQSNVYHFSVRIIDASNAMYDVTFEYDSADMSAVYTYLRTYCTVTDTLSTDYKLKVTAKEGYKIARLYNSEYMVGGVDNTNPNNYISNLVTTPSYVHDGQDVIDDIYDKLDDKQDTLQSGTNIKTINNESILGSGNIDIQGGGKAVSGGTNISITTGETADTINCTLPISVGRNTIEINKKNIKIGTNNTTSNNDRVHCVIGENSAASGIYSFAFGVYSKATNYSTVSMGYGTESNNQYQASFGRYNTSSNGSSTFGDSGNTLFSVGNGTANLARHNAFEIRQNGDIYLTLDGQDVKLQDHLGGGGSSYTAGDGIDITNDVISVTGKVDTTTYNTYTAATDTALSSKADTATTYTKTEVDTALGGKADTSAVTEVSDALTAHTANTTVHTTAAEKTSWNGAVTDIATVSGQVSTNTTNIATVSAATTANTTALGGLSLVKLTQAEYDALTTKNNSTLYVIVD